MKTKVIIYQVLSVLLFIMCSSTVLYSQTYVNREWQTNSGNPLFLQWNKSIIPQSGGLITVGNTSVTGQGANVLLTKYDGHGNISWSSDYNSSGTHNDYGVDLIEDSHGNIYVCGTTDNGGGTNFDVIILKYKSDGSLLWSKLYNSSFNKNDVATSIKEKSGYVYIAAASEGDTTKFDYLTISYDSTGAFKWGARYDFHALNEFPVGIEISGGNSVVITGASASSSTNWDFTAVAYNLNGTQLNVRRDSIAGSGFDQATAYTKDNLGNIYITGKGSINGTDYDMKTIKLNSAFDIVWHKTYNGFSLEDQSNAIATDANSNVIIGGCRTNTHNVREAVAIMYDSSGIESWHYSRTSDDETGNAEVKAIDVNLDNEIYLAIEIKG